MILNKFYWVGYGSIAKTLLELFNLENNLYFDIPNVIIDPLPPKHTELFKGRNVQYIQKALTRNNYRQLLDGVDDKTLIIDLSVNVDTIMLLKFCKERGCYYINTSIENYEDDEKKPSNKKLTYADIKDDTLYHRVPFNILSASSSR